MRRYCLFLAMAFVLGLAPTVVRADDNEIAQHIVQRLNAEQQRGNLRGFHVDLRVEQGTVWFKGFVSDKNQEMLILRAAQQAGHLGVVQVVDDIDVRSQANNMNQRIGSAPMETYGQQPAVAASWNQAAGYAAPASYQDQIAPGPMSQAPVNVASNMGAPMPVAYGGGMGITNDNPQLPGYAWPGYAAHPNYAAVTYPRQYSASAWPYIGPFYPYPQVPLGWRKVTLEWDDGWWFLDFKDR